MMSGPFRPGSMKMSEKVKLEIFSDYV